MRAALDMLWELLPLLSLGLQAYFGHREKKRAEAFDRVRLRALVVCDRLEREGRGLRGATLDELRILREALE